MTQKQPSEIFGIMTTLSVELAPENKEEAAKISEMNKELQGAGFSFRTGRFVTDWGFETFDELKDAISAASQPREESAPPKRIKKDKFESGMLVKIFKTVSEGDVLWDGEVNLEYEREKHKAVTGYEQQAVGGYWVHGLQDGMEPVNWGAMFFLNLPAKLERDGKTVYGALEPFAETGTEGVIWSLHEYGKEGYEGLHCLESGDKLTVYSAVYDGEVDWEGEVLFGAECPAKLDWQEIYREPLHMEAQKWLQMTYQNRPVAIRPN